MRSLLLSPFVSAVLAAGLACQSAPDEAPAAGVPLLLPQAPQIARLAFGPDGRALEATPVPLDGYWELSPTHQDMVTRLFRMPADRPRVHGCWQALPSEKAALLFTAAIQGPQTFPPFTRWSFTATSGGGLQQGDPTIIRYSFVPDGTFLPPGVGEPGGASNLFFTLNTAFGSALAWQNVVHSAFDRWGELTGLTYVYEPNDDGASFGSAGGAIGVRGDVRIGMKFIDGGGNILAYNSYPNNGDMVLDSGDVAFFANASQNYRRFFNVLTHEHGHGIGIAHVCPVNQTKLMEPTVTTAYSGPQFDDILTGQRLYGDAREPNDSIAQPTDLGTLPDGTNNQTNLSIDGFSDIDNFRFTVLSNKIVTVSAVPTRASYLAGPQVGNCSSGTLFNPSSLRNLNLYLYNNTGTQLLGFAAAAGLGQPEVIPTQQLGAGSYIVRVTASGTDTIQPYRLELAIVDNGPVSTAVPVGTGCGGLTWNALTTPKIGNTLVQTLTGITNPAGSIGLVLLGATEIPGGLDLAAVGAPGCRTYLQADDIVVQFPLIGTTMIYTLLIPNNPQLVGSTLMTQGALLVPPGTNALGGLTGNATRLTFGTQ